MGTTPLREFLQSLCCNSRWNYAVFWKLQQQCQMLLTWEDGYCNTPHQRDSTESILADSSFGGSKEMSSCNGFDGTLGEYAVELALAYMSSAHYALGDGVVGDVAYSGNYRWVFSESMSSGEFGSTLIREHPDEWLLQFAAGIKTILLVPLVPHGVLQLGSLEMLPEDASIAAYIKDEFVAHQRFLEYSEAFAMDRQLLAQAPSLLMSTLNENMDEFPLFRMNEITSDDPTAIDVDRWSNQKPLTKSLITPPCDGPCPSHLAETDMLRSSINLTEADACSQMDSNKLGVIDCSMSRCPEEEVPANCYFNSSSIAIFEENAHRLLLSEMGMKQSLVNNVGSLTFPKECELHKALGPAFMGKTSNCIQDPAFNPSIIEDVHSSSSQIGNEDLVCGTSSPPRETNGVIVDVDDAEIQLDHVFPNICLGEHSSIQTSGSSSPTNSFGPCTPLAEGQNLNGKSAIGRESSLLRNQIASAVFSSGKNLTARSSPSATSYESVISELTEEGGQKTRYDFPHQMKGSKPSGASKRRGKPGDKQKPRPRDRQLIQDRLKELRELVPNGEKCSIDGLLDRTVTHMLFLKSVSDRANKLKHWVHQEGAGLKTKKTPEQRGSDQNGASWAFELGGDQEICPILVEDLEYPGHMTIEMICDESGRFLEIAEVIHGLDLTILKGVMEKRSGNTWAHFVIEAPKGLHRLDIFWPLMKLLQQQRSPISSKI